MSSVAQVVGETPISKWERGGSGAQSVIFGIHPEGVLYERQGTIREIDFTELKWPWGAFWDIKTSAATNRIPFIPQKESLPSAEQATDNGERQGDRKLKEDALREEITTKYGRPAFFEASKGITAINERFWAALLAAENTLVHEPDEKQFYGYEPPTGLYVPKTDHAIRNLFADRILRASREWKGFGKLEEFMSSRDLSGVIMHLRGVSESRPFNERGRNYIHCKNCVLELTPDGQFIPREFSPEFKSRNRSPIRYEPGAKCERFVKEVLGVLCDEDRQTIQKMFGSMLLGYNIAQKILMLHGVGGTGKTTLALILQGIVGSENISELRTRHLDDRFEIARYLGKSLLMGVDVNSDFLSGNAISRLKGLVGGDFMDAERKSSNENFRLHGIFNVLITSNSRLRVKLQGDQAAWRRRLILVGYEKERSTKTIRDFDQLILRQEAPGILLWGLEGLAKLRADLAGHGDIVLSDRQRDMVEGVLEESDSLRIFLKREIVGTDKSDLSVDEIVSAYLAFCVERRWVPMLAGTVQRQLESLMLEYFGVGKSNDIQRGNKAVRGFRGVRFRLPDEE